MPSKKKKYNARFPAGRIKKIMQTDEEVGKVAQAVPVIISRTLELFVESLLTKSMQITQARNAKTLTPSHMKQCILSESRFDFLKDLVKNIPDASIQEDNENNAISEENLDTNKTEDSIKMEESDDSEKSNTEEELTRNSTKNEKSLQMEANDYSRQSTSTSRTPVIQYGPKIVEAEATRLNFSVNRLLGQEDKPKLHITIASENSPVPQLVPANRSVSSLPTRVAPSSNVPPLIPFSQFSPNTSENLCIDEDYDN
ncbi:negative cofactor 2 alpha [Leptinotarsa decemlineata]|uniref:negative cofactor 2 alpha n=1 Tax=Leptinotarsa decemlineata TaxID=7539 RepID=UPI000C255574|nr:dr1-associated corepressor [Leptinotarsa decemlineata]